jgi:hypothetical protein
MGNIRVVITPLRHPKFNVIYGAEARDQASGTLLAAGKQVGMEDGGLVVEETQYSPAGSVIYKGKIFFDAGGERVKEEWIEGAKKWDIFHSWHL